MQVAYFEVKMHQIRFRLLSLVQ